MYLTLTYYSPSKSHHTIDKIKFFIQQKNWYQLVPPDKNIVPHVCMRPKLVAIANNIKDWGIEAQEFLRPTLKNRVIY